MTWDVLEDEVVIGFAISQQVRCLQTPSLGHAHLHPRSLSFQILLLWFKPIPSCPVPHGLGGNLASRPLCSSAPCFGGCSEERAWCSPRPWWTGQEAVVSGDVSAHKRPLHHSVLSSLGFQKKDVRMLRFIQEVNTTTRSCALWDLEEDTEYIVHVQSISIQGQSPASEPVLFKTPREAEKLASKNKGKCG